MEGNLERLETLLKKGENFDYYTFGIMGPNNYPRAYTTEYGAWKVGVETALLGIFGVNSPVFEMFKSHENINTLGNGQGNFQRSHQLIVGALSGGIDLLKFTPIKEEINKEVIENNKVFIVHGHDDDLKNQTDIFLKGLGLEPIVLHRQADEGLTIIEKFEKYSDVGFAFVLLTPDDLGYPKSEQSKDNPAIEMRARQNVIFEFGFFVGKLGRKRVYCLYKEGVTLPNDVSGLLYKKVGSDIEEAAYSIIKNLKTVGMDVKI